MKAKRRIISEEEFMKLSIDKKKEYLCAVVNELPDDIVKELYLAIQQDMKA